MVDGSFDRLEGQNEVSALENTKAFVDGVVYLKLIAT